MKLLTNVKKGNPVILIKNGKPVSVLLNFEEWSKREEERNREKRTKIIEDFFKEEPEMTNAAKKLLIDNNLDPKTATDEQILDLLYEQDEKNRKKAKNNN